MSPKNNLKKVVKNTQKGIGTVCTPCYNNKVNTAYTPYLCTEENVAKVNNIAKIRLEKGLTQESLATLAKINVRYIQDLENGRANPSLKIVYKIAYVLNATIEDLFPAFQNIKGSSK